MTREEATQICKEVRHCLWIADEQKTTTIWDKGAVSEAMLMAIEALKQVTGKLNDPDDSLLTADSEACKEQKSKLDLISREEVIEAIEIVDWYHQNSNKDMVHGANDDEHQAWYKAQDIYKAIEAVPSADRPRDGDLISRQAAIDAIYDKGSSMTAWGELLAMKWSDIQKCIEQLPSADRPKGEWVNKEGIHGAAYCSECDYELHSNNTNFCPNCGADMRERSE